MPPRSSRFRRLRNWTILGVLVALAAASFYFGGLIDISASTLRIGYGTAERRNFDDEPFSIGNPDQYRKPGVYFDYAKSHGVYIVTTYDMVVALSVENPANGRPTRYEPMADQYSDAVSGDRFDSNGLLLGQSRNTRRVLEDAEAVKAHLEAGSGISRSLERCYIRLKGSPDSPDAELIVDPRHRFLFELNQWSRSHSAWHFPE